MNVLYVLFALDILNTAVYLPAFAPYIRSLGGTPLTLGFINSSCALISLFWNPIIGSLSDQIGRRTLLTKCMLASSIGSIILSLSSTSLFLAFVGKLVGAFGSPVNILLRTLVADSYQSAEDKKKFFDKSAPILSLSFLFGSLASGFLTEAKHGYSKVFLLMASIMGFAYYFANKNLTNDLKTVDVDAEKSSFANKALKKLKTAILDTKSISWPRYWPLFVIKGFHDFGMATVLSNLGLILLNEFGIKGRSMGYVFVSTSLFTIIANIMKIKLKKTFETIPDYVKVIQSGIIMIVSYLGISLSSSIYVFLLFLGALCMARAFLDTTLTEMITTKTLEHDRGKVISAFDNLNPLALFLAPALSGLFAEIFGQRLLIASATVPLATAIYVAFSQKNKAD